MKISHGAMTVKEALSEVAGKRILVPEFVGNVFDWYDSKKIESIFESILKGYPIGGFTFWNLEEPVPNIMFYEMTEHYTDSSSERQKRFEMGFRPFRAVLDGKNRLNSLYIGLSGTYTGYTEFEDEVDKENPPQTLYLNLWRPETSESEPEQCGHFRFLTEEDYEKETQNGAVWVKAGRILDEDVPSIPGSVPIPPEAAKEAEEVLVRLADGICSRKIVSGYSVEDGPLEDVIDLFMQRTSFWEPCYPCPDQKLFYLLAADWDEARAEFERLEDLPKNDWHWHDKSDFLNICLALVGDERCPSAGQFTALIPKIKKEWRRIRTCIHRLSSLFRNIYGECSCRLDTDQALVIMYWLYKKGGYGRPKDSEDLNAEFESAVKKWMAFCDYINSNFTWEENWLPVFKKIIDETENKVFPFAALRESIIDDYIRERIDVDDFEKILASSWDGLGLSGPIEPKILLPLLSPERATGELKKVKAVHLHPRSFFEDPEKLVEVFKENPRDLLFAADPKNWNSVLNLCLMPVEKADMKEQMSLKEWVKITGMTKKELCVDDEVSLDIKDFRAFIENRRKRIKAILGDLLS